MASCDCIMYIKHCNFLGMFGNSFRPRNSKERITHCATLVVEWKNRNSAKKKIKETKNRNFGQNDDGMKKNSRI